MQTLARGLAALLLVSCAGPGERASAPNDPQQVTTVAVLGMIHGTHRTSELWGSEDVRETIRRFGPDAVLTEIPPDRWERVLTDWNEREIVEDDRVLRFPEYTDALFPLMSELGFEVVPCAAWTRQMSDERQKRMSEFQESAAFAVQRAAYEVDEAALAELEEPTPSDDPAVLHSTAYDEWTRARLRPYDEHMNDHLGAGGWTNINAAHMRLIDQAIDARPGQRLLITFGAGHKYWFLDRLRERDDVRVLSVDPYLPVRGDSVDEACRTEISELHAFFEDWFAGRVPDSDASYARLTAALHPEFEIVSPGGVVTGRAQLLELLRSMHGSAPDGERRLWIRAARSRELGDGHLLATYEEWQQHGDEPTGRLSTAVFERSTAAPNGLLWVRVHETWLPTE